MKRILLTTSSGLLLAAGCLVGGCVVHGTREVEIEFLGQTISVKDTVSPDSAGKTDYKVGLDEESGFLGQAFGWLFPETIVREEDEEP